MATDVIYESCLPILKDENLEDEDKTERLEELMRERTQLTGKSLENAVLDVLWRFRTAATPGSSSPTVRHTIVRRNSPAPWQASRSSTPLGMSPRSSAAVSPAPSSTVQRPSLIHMKSSTQGVSMGGNRSPFGSPRPSPAMSYVYPRIPHSPSLNAYEFHEPPPPSQSQQQHQSAGDVNFGDCGSDNVEWLVSDNGTSNLENTYGGDYGETPDLMLANEWVTPQLMEMGPYDILRSILRDDRSDEEIEEILEANGYDLGLSIAALMSDASGDVTSVPHQEKTYLVGKSMASNSRPMTPSTGQARNPVVCRYWLANGSCLRADCRFSHELTNHVCKYWMEGKCLAGASCLFSHDPAMLVANLSLTNPSLNMTPPVDAAQLSYSTQDFAAFPALGVGATSGNMQSLKAPLSAGESSLRSYFSSADKVAPPPGFSSRGALAPEFIPSRPQSRSRPSSRPSSSRHQSPAPKVPMVNSMLDEETEAFPSLGSTAKTPKKHHGKRGHGHGHNKDKDNSVGSTSMADVVRKAPSSPQSPRRSLRSRAGQTGNGGSTSAAAQAIPAPQRIPWLDTGDSANKAYIKARQEAIRHGGARNKFLQSAAQAWNRNDVRAAKALSLRGQSENDLMREAHREAARFLYEERNNHNNGKEEIFIDLHGLHPAEAVSYLSNSLSTQRSRSALFPDPSPFLYAIVGTGHHSKNGRDKVGKAIRAYLNECRYAFKEFSAPGDKGANGGILGIDASTGDVTTTSARAETVAVASASPEKDGSGMEHGKIRILKHDEAKEQGLTT